MKISTRIKKYVPHERLWSKYPPSEFIDREIVFMVDCESVTEYRTYSLEAADHYHRYLTRDERNTFLPQESPVVNATQIILHYTSTTYKDWCNRN